MVGHMNFEELDSETRRWMLTRLDLEEAMPVRYRPKNLSKEGEAEYPRLLRGVIESSTGSEVSLAQALSDQAFWQATRFYERKGKIVEARIDPFVAARRLALTEFNTYYVAGLAHRLQSEGINDCEVYRAADPVGDRASCSDHEGQRYLLTEVISGHRATYWPQADLDAFSIPAGPNCHHSIRR